METLGAGQRKPEARHHFVKDKYRTLTRTLRTYAGEEAGVGQDEADVRRERLKDDARNGTRVSLKGLLECR